MGASAVVRPPLSHRLLARGARPPPQIHPRLGSLLRERQPPCPEHAKSLTVNMERLKRLLAEYGRVALGTYFAIFFLALAGFALALSQGLELASLDLGGAGSAGVFAGAYVATKVTQPVRIAATLALTPIVAAVLRRTMRTARVAQPEEAPLHDSQR